MLVRHQATCVTRTCLCTTGPGALARWGWGAAGARGLALCGEPPQEVRAVGGVHAGQGAQQQQVARQRRGGHRRARCRQAAALGAEQALRAALGLRQAEEDLRRMRRAALLATHQSLGSA